MELLYLTFEIDVSKVMEYESNEVKINYQLMSILIVYIYIRNNNKYFFQFP